MKNKMTFLICMALSFCLGSCSHTYVKEFGGGQVTTCCPTHKIFCSQDKLDEAAAQFCGGPATIISGGTIDSGASAYGSQNYAEMHVTHDMCITYKCH